MNFKTAVVFKPTIPHNNTLCGPQVVTQTKNIHSAGIIFEKKTNITLLPRGIKQLMKEITETKKMIF